MWHLRRATVETLCPETYADRRALYQLIRDELVKRQVAPRDIVRRLSIAAVRHLSGEGGKILLQGSFGTGTAALVRSLTEVLGLPLVEISAGMLAEQNWKGSDLGFFLHRLYSGLWSTYPAERVPYIAERACVFIDDIDAARLPGAYTGSEATRDHREGQQRSLAALCSGAPIPVSEGGAVWHSRDALVIVSGEFHGLGWRVPDADQLTAWGLIPSLSQALSTCAFISLPPPTAAHIEHIVRKDARRLEKTVLGFGYHLRITDQVVRWVCDAVSSGRNAGGADAAARWISDATETALVRLLEEGAPVGTHLVLAPDDVALPEAARGMWRE